MDVHSIKQYIINNPEHIQQILETAGFHRVRKINEDEYRCAYDENSNPTSVSIRNTLAASDFGRGINGDIITLVSHKTGLGFRETLGLICESIGLDVNRMKSRAEIKLPFGGFYKHIGKNRDDKRENEVIDDSILDRFAMIPSQMFIEDNISAEQQIRFNIGYDSLTKRVVIPWHNTRGELIGIIGRKNSVNVEEGVFKYFPIIPHSKSLSLFGYHQNYKNMVEEGVVIVCESEKSVMKLGDMLDVNTSVALGGSTVSQVQAQNIQATMPKVVILGLDEGLEEEHMISEANKIKLTNPFIDIKVGYIWDENNEVMTKGGKQAPMDKTKEEFQYLLKNCVKWV